MLEYLTVLVALYVGWSLLCMEIVYRRHSAIGVPLLRLPIDPLNIPYQVFEPHFFRFIDALPAKLVPNFVQYMRRGWFFSDKSTSHQRYGPIFGFATPRRLHLYVADSNAVHDMFTRRLDFQRPSENYKLLEVYGPSITTATPAEWPRHRKVLATPFNETAMQFVWDESFQQAIQMLSTWTDQTVTAGSIRNVAKDTRTLSLNVLAAVGFRRSFPFQPAGGPNRTTDVAASYRDALSTVLDNVILLMLVPYRYLQLPIFPRSLQRIGRAGAEYKQHMERMLKEELLTFERHSSSTRGLMTSFAKALNTHEGQKSGAAKAQGLSKEEILGNMFVINFAGHDTTANTLAFAMLLLATKPHVQEWLAGEVSKVATDGDEWNYASIFPRLIRCRAVLLETLRLYPPIMTLPKHTYATSQRLEVGDRAFLIPANTYISPSIMAMHTHPRYWAEPLVWKPSRWITSNTSAGAMQDEKLSAPANSAFYPWSDGPQNCPGEKFSQVEFVGVLASLMRTHSLEIVTGDGETEGDAKRRVRNVINDCDMEILLRMKDAGKARLRCVARAPA